MDVLSIKRQMPPNTGYKIIILNNILGLLIVSEEVNASDGFIQNVFCYFR